MKKTAFITLLCLTMIMVVTMAYAEEEVGKKLSDEGELAYVKTGGNTDVTSLAAKNQMRYRMSDKVLDTWKLGAVYGETSKVKTAESYFTELKVDYLFTEKFYAFADAGWLQDKFAGIDERLYGGAGAGYKFLNGPANLLVGELGLNYVADHYIDRTRNGYLAGRAYGKYTYAFTEKNKLSQSVEYLHNFENAEKYDVNSETAVISAMSGNLSLKAAYLVNFRNKPTPETLKKTDTMLTVALVVNY